MRRFWCVVMVASAIALSGCSNKVVAPPTEVSLSGRVVNLDGSPSDNAVVELEPLAQGPLYLLWVATPSVGGAFRIDHIPPGEYILSARAEAPGTDAAAMRIRVPGLRLPPVLRLAPPGSVVGRVTLSDSATLDGSSVYTQGTFGFTTTDVTGDYRIDGVPVGTWRVYANRPGYEPAWVNVTIRGPGMLAQVPEMVLSPYASAASPTTRR